MPFDFDPVIRSRNLTPKKSEVVQPQGTIDPFGETVIDPYAIHAEEIDFRTPNNAQPAAVLTETHSDPVAVVQEPEPKTDSSPVQKEIVTEPTVVITKEITPVIKKSTNKHHLKDATDLEDSIKIYDEITRKLYEKEAAETSKTSTLELPVGRVETVKKGYEVKITHNRTLSKLIF